ncbi:hypothetical protein [Microcoleus sp. B7-D4]|uniref:hypothetical protein n=1 Tax=Microcoleus sp. B7-D4 TaxID=2818696 RepID=UPI002FCEC1B5
MELTEACLKIIGSSFPRRESEELTVEERVKKDLEYVKEVKDKFNELEAAVIKRTSDCNENSSDWPECRLATRKKLVNILSVTVPNAFSKSSSESEKLAIIKEYLEAISKDPSIIAPLLE